MHTNTTTNYDLPQFVGTDKPSWLGDVNGAMSAIDTAIHAREVEAGTAQASADTANAKADTLDTRMGTAETNITALQNASTTDHAQIATNTSSISQNAQDIVQLDAKIGHTQITIGDNTVTGAIAELASEVGGTVDAEDVSYDNTQSGLTATNVQDAIDEIKGDIPAIPSTYDADDIVYDNTTSGLTATNVQDAISELAGANSEVSVVGDGTKTFTQLLTSLFALLDLTKVNGNTVLQIVGASGTNNYVLSSFSSTELIFNFTIGDTNGCTTQVLKVSASGSAIQLGQTTSGNTVTDIGSNSAGTGTFKVIY